MNSIIQPTRQSTMQSAMSEDAVPSGDPRNTTELLAERMSAWRCAVEYVDEYVNATERMERAQAKEYEKVLKTIQSPLRAGHHFDQNVGGIAGLFENMRQNTQAMINTHLETEKNIRANVIPIVDRLRRDIKQKTKELASGALKSVKEVEKARNITQKYIELLGQNAAGFDASGSRFNSSEDPYVLRRGVLHRLSKQVMEENNHRHELVALQQNFGQFEQHIVEVIQTTLAALTGLMNGQGQSQEQHYSDMLGTAQAIPSNFEWIGFLSRSGDILIDPTTPDRNMDSITFPNQDHRATNPIIEGTLERKSRNKLSFSGFSTGYYAVTPSKYLHEFKDDDNIRKDPTPELSIYLPDATLGVPNGEKFHVKGKDVSKGLGSKLTGTPEIQFKAATADEAQKWFKAFQIAISNVPSTIVATKATVANENIATPVTSTTPIITTAPSSDASVKKSPEETAVTSSLPSKESSPIIQKEEEKENLTSTPTDNKTITEVSESVVAVEQAPLKSHPVNPQTTEAKE